MVSIDSKILNKILEAKYDEVGFVLKIQGWSNMYKSINMVNNIHGYKNKNHTTIQIDAENPVS